MSHPIMRTFILAVLALTLLAQVKAVNLDIIGLVVAAPCTVSPVLEAGQSVSLGSLSSSKFKNPGDADTTWHNFSLELTNCPGGTTQSTVTFSGTADANDATLFANTEPPASAAPNMAVQVSQQSNNSVIVSNGSTMTVNVNTQNGTASFPLAARMKTPKGNTQAGNVTSTMLVSFTYQ